MRHTTLAAVLAIALSTPAVAGDRQHGGGHGQPPTCGGGCGGHRPHGGSTNVNVNVNARASAHAEADARSHLNARAYASDIGRVRGGGGVIYSGGGYADSSVMESSGHYIAPIEHLGPAPVSAPFGYAARGFGRTYIGWQRYQGHCDCAPPPREYYDREDRYEYEERYYETREERSYEERYEGHYEEDRFDRSGARGRTRVVQAPPVYVRGPDVHVLAPEVIVVPGEVHVAPPVYVTPPPVYVTAPAVHVAAPVVHLEASEVAIDPPVHVTPPPVHVQAPPVHVAAPEVYVAPDPGEEPLPPPPGYYGDLPPPDAPPLPQPPRHNYRQVPGERG